MMMMLRECPFTAHLFISEEKSKAVFKAGKRTIDGAALRYSPPSLRGAADDPSLRNQLQQLFLSRGRGQAVKLGTKEPRQLLYFTASHTANTPQRKLRAAAAAVKYLFTMYLHKPEPPLSDKIANTHITSTT